MTVTQLVEASNLVQNSLQTQAMKNPKSVKACIAPAEAKKHAEAPTQASTKENLSLQTSTPYSLPPPYIITEDEAKLYYYGISPPPTPRLLYRTDLLETPWGKHSGDKGMRGIFGHRLEEVWDEVVPQVLNVMKTEQVAWTSIDRIRFFTFGDENVIKGPVVIWVGVHPSGASQGERLVSSSHKILEILEAFGIYDVTVEYHESARRPWMCSLFAIIRDEIE